MVPATQKPVRPRNQVHGEPRYMALPGFLEMASQFMRGRVRFAARTGDGRYLLAGSVRGGWIRAVCSQNCRLAGLSAGATIGWRDCSLANLLANLDAGLCII